MGIFEGHLRVHKGAKFALVAARWNDFIVERLVGGAQDCLRRHGAADDAMDLIKVPGSFELPLTTDAQGYLVAKSDFTQPVGPSFWERG